MSPARTRSSAVKQAPQQLSSPPATPSPTEKKPTREGRRTLRKGTHPNSAELDDFVENENVTPIGSSKKRKRTAPSKTIEPVTPVSEGKKRKRAVLPTAEADPGDLPHGLGRLPVNSDQAARDGTPPPTPESDQAKFETSNPKELVQSDQLEESVHLGLEIELVHTGNKLKIQDLLPDALEAPTLAPQGKKQRKAKVPYGHHFDATPFPDFDGPKSEVFYTVNGLLTTVHGEKKAPAAIPPPSKDWAGCGETPSVLDAMIRTLLSANTRGEGSGVAIKALFDTYGTVVDGKGRESVDWDLIRRSPIEKITKAIKPGGHQNEKGKRIKDILDMVFLENNIRRKAIADPTFRQKLGLDNESVVQESAMLTCVDPKILTLDHLHGLPYHQVFNALLKYPGIALKTASCVSLYCFQRPSFAVDTHVHRITGWLGWRPEKADTNKTFGHLEYMIPDELKYSLHTLFVQHGKECVRCQSKTHALSPGWEKGCVIDHLVKRVKNHEIKQAGKGTFVQTVLTGPVVKNSALKTRKEMNKVHDVSEEEEDDDTEPEVE